jgi:hypothetical protein
MWNSQRIQMEFSKNSNAVCEILPGKIQNMILVFLLFLSFILKGGDFAIYLHVFLSVKLKQDLLERGRKEFGICNKSL